MLEPIALEPVSENSPCSVYVGLKYEEAHELAVITGDILMNPYDDCFYFPSVFRVYVKLDENNVVIDAKRGKPFQEEE